MIIKTIELSNYRNYEKLSLELDQGTNIFYGDNAQGKTNILEAAYLSGTSKSHKGTKDRDIIRFGQDESHIRTLVEKNKKEYQIDISDVYNTRILMEAYNLLGICIVDESLEIAKFMWDTGEDLWETVAFSNLERESNDNTYKKVVNLMTKVM